MDEIFSVEQVSKKLGCHLMTVYKLISSGSLKAMHLPGIGLRVGNAELENFLAENKRKTKAKRRKAPDAKSRK